MAQSDTFAMNTGANLEQSIAKVDGWSLMLHAAIMISAAWGHQCQINMRCSLRITQ